MKPIASILIVVALVALPWFGAAADPYEINVILPVTGSGAFIAHADMNALFVIERMVNKSGGIQGRPIKFVVQDDQSNPALAVQLLNGVIAKHVPIVLGSTLAATCNAMAPLLKNGPVEYCFSPGIHPPEGSYVYSAGVGVVDLISAVARYCRERGWRKIAIITSTDATGQDADQAVDQVFGTPVATVLRGVRDGGLDVPIVSTNGNMSYAQMRQYTNILPKELLFPGLPSFSPDQLPRGPLKGAVTRFLDAFRPFGILPENGENQVWDATLILIDALKRYGFNASPAQIRDYINGLHGWTGIYGRFDYHAIPQRGVGIDAVIIQRWDPSKGVWIGVSKPGGSPLR